MTEKIIPETLVVAREAASLNQSDVALALDISQSKVSKLESGRLDPTEAEIEKLSRLYRRPASFFRETIQRRGAGASWFHGRMRRSVSRGALRKTHAQLDIRCLEIDRLFRDIEFTGVNGFAPMNPEHYEHNMEAMAARVRAKWSIPHGPVSSMVQAIEAAGGIVVPCKFASLKIDALSVAPSGKPPLFFVNMEIPADKMRFTLAHEVAHILMDGEDEPGPKELEQRADRFAAAFLMPAGDVEKDLCPGIALRALAALKPKWKVSIKSLIYRAGTLGALEEPQQRWLYIQYGKHGWTKREPLEIPAEEPTLIQAAIDLHRNEHEMSMDQIAALVRSTTNEFLADYFPTKNRLRLVN